MRLAAGLLLLPGIFSWRKADWPQACAAVGFAAFLLTTPALVGVHTRSQPGVVLPQQAALRLTPTLEAQTITRLNGGEMARLERERSDYLYVRATTPPAGSAVPSSAGNHGVSPGILNSFALF